MTKFLKEMGQASYVLRWTENEIDVDGWTDADGWIGCPADRTDGRTGGYFSIEGALLARMRVERLSGERTCIRTLNKFCEFL